MTAEQVMAECWRVREDAKAMVVAARSMSAEAQIAYTEAVQIRAYLARTT
jgi:hypothetical protein